MSYNMEPNLARDDSWQHGPRKRASRRFDYQVLIESGDGNAQPVHNVVH